MNIFQSNVILRQASLPPIHDVQIDWLIAHEHDLFARFEQGLRSLAALQPDPNPGCDQFHEEADAARALIRALIAEVSAVAPAPCPELHLAQTRFRRWSMGLDERAVVPSFRCGGCGEERA